MFNVSGLKKNRIPSGLLLTGRNADSSIGLPIADVAIKRTWTTGNRIMRLILAGSLAVGMQIVEADGGLIDVVSVSKSGVNVVAECKSLNGSGLITFRGKLAKRVWIQK